MAISHDDRTEAPTPRRRQEARERGQVARSTDLTAAVVLLGGMIALRAIGPQLLRVLLGMMDHLLGGPTEALVTAIELPRLWSRLLTTVAVTALPLLITLMVIAAAVNLFQIGPMLSAHPLAPKWGKINPLAGFGRLFSMPSAAQLVVNLFKLGLVTKVAYDAIAAEMPRLVAATELDVWDLLLAGADMTYWLGIKLGVALLVIALLDFLYRRWQHERDLRMTREEVKEEMRRMEGDPIVKQRRRQIQLQLALQRLRKDVPKANVIVTNPTELAIALKYDEKTMHAPVVIAKGAGVLAARIRELAAAHGIPIIERKPLAQALYKMVEVGQEIPSQFYKAVAEILAYVYELSRGRRRRSA